MDLNRLKKKGPVFSLIDSMNSKLFKLIIKRKKKRLLINVENVLLMVEPISSGVRSVSP